MEKQFLKKGKNEALAACQEAFFDAVDQICSPDCSKKDCDEFVFVCKKITDAHLLCSITTKLKFNPYAPLYYESKGEHFFTMVALLVEILIDLLNSECYNDTKLEEFDLSVIAVKLFNVNDFISPDILTKLISNRYISQQPRNVERILCKLIRKDFLDTKELTSDDNFCTLLRQFGKVTAENKRAQLHRCYKMIIQFLVKSYDWVLAKELLP